MNEESLVTHRLQKLEQGHEELKIDLKDLSIKSAETNVILNRIDQNLKWVTGGIFLSILTAIGKFIISGKLV